MKFHKIAFLLIGGIIIATTACKKTFFTDINNNPNVPPSVGPALILSTTEAALAYTQGGDFSRFASLFMQQVVRHQQPVSGVLSIRFKRRCFR